MVPGIQSVRSMGTLPRAANDLWILVGQDGGQSIPVGERTLFVFSDTLLSARTPMHPNQPVPPAFRADAGKRSVFLANCAGLSDGATLLDAWAGIDYFRDGTGFPREILTPTQRERAQEIRFWPEHGVSVNGSVYLYYIGVQTVDPTTIWGFQNAGAGLARLDPETGVCERILRRNDWRLFARKDREIHFGVQVLRDDDFCYVFGSMRDGLERRAMLARVRASEIENPDAYTYLSATGREWSESIDEACDLGPSATDFSVSWNAHLGCWLMLYINPYSKVLTMRTAAALWGPYSEPRPIIGVPHEKTTELVYLGFEHPAFTPDAGRTVLVSYCQPHFTNNSLVAVKFK